MMEEGRKGKEISSRKGTRKMEKSKEERERERERGTEMEREKGEKKEIGKSKSNTYFKNCYI